MLPTVSHYWSDNPEVASSTRTVDVALPDIAFSMLTDRGAKTSGCEGALFPIWVEGSSLCRADGLSSTPYRSAPQHHVSVVEHDRLPGRHCPNRLVERDRKAAGPARWRIIKT